MSAALPVGRRLCEAVRAWSVETKSVLSVDRGFFGMASRLILNKAAGLHLPVMMAEKLAVRPNFVF